MRFATLHVSSTATFLLLAPLVAFADPINQVLPGTLVVPISTDFEDYPPAGSPGTNFNGVLISGSASFAERFLGQTLSFSGNFDVLSGTPSTSLALQVGASGQNVNVLTSGSNVVDGLGPLGFPNSNAIGEGALAVLFPSNQFELGLDIVGTNGGSATLDFFRGDGSLIQRLVLSGLTNGSYAFRRDLSVSDIAGVSVFNDDPGGIGYDNFRYNPGIQAVPEPSTLVLLALGTIGLAGHRWRRGKQRWGKQRCQEPFGNRFASLLDANRIQCK